MLSSSHTSRTFGLAFLAALALLAFTAVGAQAEGEFEIEGKTFTELKIKEEAMKIEQKGATTFSVAKLNVEISCQGGGGSGTLLAKGVGHGTLEEKECTVRNSETKEKLAACQISGGGFPIPLLFLAQLIAGNKVVVLVETPPAQPAILSFGKECALGEETELEGSFSTEASGAEAVEQVLEFNTGSKAGKELQELMGDKLFYDNEEALAVSILGLRLAGTHVTLTWRVR